MKALNTSQGKRVIPEKREMNQLHPRAVPAYILERASRVGHRLGELLQTVQTPCEGTKGATVHRTEYRDVRVIMMKVMKQLP